MTEQKPKPKPNGTQAADGLWRPLDETVRDGRPLWLKGERGEVAECYWHTTRRFHKTSWQKTGFFSKIGTNPMPLNFTPVAYARNIPIVFGEDKPSAA